MKTSRIFILIIAVLIVVVPIMQFFTIDSDINACMIEYVDSFEDSGAEWYIYKIDGRNHIEPKNSMMNQYIQEHKVGYANGCIMTSGNLFTDFNNSVYCSLTYLTKKIVYTYTDNPEESFMEKFIAAETHKNELVTYVGWEYKLVEDESLKVINSQFANLKLIWRSLWEKYF